LSTCQYAILPFSAAVGIACIHHATVQCWFSSAEGAEAHTSPQVDRESDGTTQHIEAVQYNNKNRRSFALRFRWTSSSGSWRTTQALSQREAMIGICELDCFWCARAPFRPCSSDKTNMHQFSSLICLKAAYEDGDDEVVRLRYMSTCGLLFAIADG